VFIPEVSRLPNLEVGGRGRPAGGPSPGQRDALVVPVGRARLRTQPSADNTSQMFVLCPNAEGGTNGRGIRERKPWGGGRGELWGRVMEVVRAWGVGTGSGEPNA